MGLHYLNTLKETFFKLFCQLLKLKCETARLFVQICVNYQSLQISYFGV
jgi:hypothetical protein